MVAEDHLAVRELTDYLRRIARWCDDVIVVDASSAPIFAANQQRWRGFARHCAPDPACTALNGKVRGVLSGLELARHDRIVIADDDVRYEQDSLHRTLGLLADHDLVRPQNYFSPRPWHAVWDTARTLINRATVGADFPGTLALRRSSLTTGGYDGDVLFENLELIRTVQARGGTVASPLDLYVRRAPSTRRHFLGQRTRQAYDEFATPLRMAVWLVTIPALVFSLVRGWAKAPLAAAALVVMLAERGRRRSGGSRVFPLAASALAPLWVLERGCCAWLAVLQRLRFGGVRYGDSVIRVAANSERTLRHRTPPTQVQKRSS
jgi:Glycosyl transferase family 21